MAPDSMFETPCLANVKLREVARIRSARRSRSCYPSDMQLLQNAINRGTPADRCATELLACVPSIMRYIRREMRSHRQSQLSIPQFRALIFASVYEGASLSDMAEHLGLSLAATSRMADSLVRRGLLQREQGAADRRRVSLSPTRAGRAAYRSAHQATRTAMARRFTALSGDERALITRSLRVLGRLFSPPAQSPPRIALRGSAK